MKKNLVIMGTHPKSREKFNWKRKDCDIWLFNEAPNLKNSKGDPAYPKADIVLQLHHEAIWKSPKNRSDEGHYSWLKSGKTPPVYMQKKYKDVPKSVEYPLNKVLSLTKNVNIVVDGKQQKFKFFSSSPDFALALAALLWKEGKKYKRVEVWGIELEMESEYQYQRTGFAFWVGYLAALGIEVILYNSIFDAPMYGYEGDVAITSQDINKRISELTKELGTDKDSYTLEANKFLKDLSSLLQGDTSSEIQKEFARILKIGEFAGILNGKIKESQRYLEKANEMEKISGASVFSLGEFDGSKTMFTKQSSQISSEIYQINSRLDPILEKLLNFKKGSQKRKHTLDEYGNLVAELMNKNIILFHLQGAIKENQFYIDSVRLSTSLAKNKK